MVKPSDYTGLILGTLDHIWEYMNVERVLLEFIIVKNEEGKFVADQELKDALKEAGFKWKSKKNDPATGNQRLLMGIARPTEGVPEFSNPRKQIIGQEPVTLKSGVIIQLEKTEEDKKDVQRVNTQNRQNLVAP